MVLWRDGAVVVLYGRNDTFKDRRISDSKEEQSTLSKVNAFASLAGVVIRLIEPYAARHSAHTAYVALEAGFV